jgi:predicted RNase H-like nuclease (RuvC/YqgF family)
MFILLLTANVQLTRCSPVPGAIQKIANLRYRHGELSESIARLEARVAEQAAQLEQMNYKVEDDVEIETYSRPVEVTDEDLERELEEIRELEQRKQMMEERVRAMEGDIGGLPR